MAEAEPRILLLSSSLGLGHVRAAEAVAEALEELHPRVRIEWVDFWSLMDERVAEAVKRGYLEAVTAAPDLYDSLYGLDGESWLEFLKRDDLPSALAPVVRNALEDSFPDADGFPARGRNLDQTLFLNIVGTYFRRWEWMGGRLRNGLVRCAYQVLARRLKGRIDAFRPHVVVSTQMLPAGLLAGIGRRGPRAGRVRVGVTTDYGLHDFWEEADMDRYCVATEAMARKLVRMGRSPEAVRVTGIPLAATFRAPPTREAARGSLGIPPAEPAVLLTGGGAGIGIRQALDRMMEGEVPARVLVVKPSQGNGDADLEAFARRHPRRFHLLDEPSDWAAPVAAADVVVGKPGGMSVSEALACGRPFLAVNSLGGQENFNVAFLEREGVGGKVAPGDLGGALDRWLSDPAKLDRIQERARALGPRHGATEVARCVLEAASGGGREERTPLREGEGRW